MGGSLDTDDPETAMGSPPVAYQQLDSAPV